jgi:hemerythrin
MSICNNLQWHKSYLIGHKGIDKEHQTLFLMAQNIEKAKTKLEVKEAVKQLVQYTKYHFKSEEKYMKEIEYDKFDEHVKLHKKIVTALEKFVNTMDTLTEVQMQQILQRFVKEYIVRHIIIEDKKVHHYRRDQKELREIFSWNDDFKIGQEEVDKEHQKLFEIAAKALQHEKHADSKKFIKQIIIELYQYMKVHFENEEKYMESIGYPEIEAHKKLHENIIDQITQFVKQIATLSLENFERKLIEYMDVWLISHIIYDDQKIQCYYLNQQKSD